MLKITAASTKAFCDKYNLGYYIYGNNMFNIYFINHKNMRTKKGLGRKVLYVPFYYKGCKVVILDYFYLWTIKDQKTI